MLRLETFGGLTLTSDQVERPQRRRRVALLARLATADERGVSRDELLAMFWPEAPAEGARHSLDQLLYEARRALGASPMVGTTTLRLDPDVIECDVTEWTVALDGGDLERAIAVYRGPFLHGFYLQSSPDFERWVESIRAHFAGQYRRALEALAAKASADGRLSDAVDLWRRLAAEDRFGSRTALGLMRAMADAGDRAGALEFARVHERIVWAELESASDPAVATYAVELRASPARERATPIPANVTPASPLPDASSTEDASAPAAAAVSKPPNEWRRSRVLLLAGAAALTLVAILYSASAFGRDPGAPNAGLDARNEVAASTPRSTARGTTNLAAYDLYQHGSDRLLQRSDSGIRRAIADLEQAVALDSNYAEAYAALARAYGTASSFTVTLSPTERQNMHARGVAAASRAIALANSLADAHAELGYLLSLGFDPLGAIVELQHSIALDSTDSAVHEVLAKSYEWADRPNDAMAAAQRAVDIDAMSAAAAAELGDALYFTRRYDQALAQLEKVVAVRPPLRRTATFLAVVYLAKRQWKEAIDVLQSSNDRYSGGLLGYTLARSGRKPEAEQLLKQMLATKSAAASSIAEVYIGLQQYDSAFMWLDRSFDDYSLNPRIMGPLFDDVHARPEFRRVRRRLGLPPA